MVVLLMPLHQEVQEEVVLVQIVYQLKPQVLVLLIKVLMVEHPLAIMQELVAEVLVQSVVMGLVQRVMAEMD